MNIGKKTLNWIKTNGTYHIVDCTALLAESLPIITAFDLGTGMEEAVSTNGKYATTSATYLGLGTAFARGNFASRRLCKITDQTPEWKITVHDITYTAVFNAIVQPLFYLASGERDLKQLVMTSGVITAVLAANGRFGMGAVEWARDLTGLDQNNKRSYPDLLRRRNSKTKKAIAVGLMAASLSAIVDMYSIHKDTPKTQDSVSTEVACVVQVDGSNQESLLEQTLFE